MRLIEALLVCLSSLVFGFLDLLDPIMGSIFAVLDAVFEAGANGGAPRGGPANGEAPPGAAPGPDPRWSDCSCSACTAWQGQESEKKLHLHHVSSSSSTGTRRRRRRRRRTAATTTRGSRAEKLDDENVLFIHGFLSSSVVWSDKIFLRLLRLLEEEEVEEEEEFGEFEQEFEEFEGGEEGPRQKASYRLLAVDLLGFGRSPKPRHCLYSMEDHIETIDASSGAASIEHLVAHSMGCIVALAFAASRPPDSIKTITLVAPPYFEAPDDGDGLGATAATAAHAHALRRLAPRRIWPLLALGVSVMSWYEHIGRAICFLVCKQHRAWEALLGTLAFDRLPSVILRDLVQHTHHSAWSVFHSILCGEAHRVGAYLSLIEQRQRRCEVHIFHGSVDELVPVECSIGLQRRHPRARLQLLPSLGHFSILYGRETSFARTLHRIWRSSSKPLKPCHTPPPSVE